MISVDTNIVVTFLTERDDPSKDKVLDVMRHNLILVTATVLLESEWVLRAVYNVPRNEIELAFRRLQAMPNVSFYPSDAVAKALNWNQGGLELPDALHVSLSSDADAFVTSDMPFIKRSSALGVRPRVNSVQEMGL
ncbi:MAG: PIN domain-containing protein [Hyphomicrobiales bacterium]